MATSSEIVPEEQIVTSSAARKVLAAMRITTGFIFLWAFLDKTFGLGFTTKSDQAWIRGGKPSQGFLTHLDPAKPLSGFFAGLASPVSDVLFMLGMLGVGLAVMLGIGTRVAAVCGTLILAMMWLAEFPPIAGAEPGTNPLIDYHVIYALIIIFVALVGGGDTWGLGKIWKSLPIVQKQRWLI